MCQRSPTQLDFTQPNSFVTERACVTSGDVLQISPQEPVLLHPVSTTSQENISHTRTPCFAVGEVLVLQRLLSLVHPGSSDCTQGTARRKNWKCPSANRALFFCIMTRTLDRCKQHLMCDKQNVPSLAVGYLSSGHVTQGTSLLNVINIFDHVNAKCTSASTTQYAGKI